MESFALRLQGIFVNLVYVPAHLRSEAFSKVVYTTVTIYDVSSKRPRWRIKEAEKYVSLLETCR